MAEKPAGRGGARIGAGRKPNQTESKESKPRGGARPGAGRKPKASATDRSVVDSMEPQAHGGALKRQKAKPVRVEGTDTRALLLDIAFGRIEVTASQLKAATAVLNDDTRRAVASGKKGAREETAKAATGKFARLPPPPRMVVNNRS